MDITSLLTIIHVICHFCYTKEIYERNDQENFEKCESKSIAILASTQRKLTIPCRQCDGSQMETNLVWKRIPLNDTKEISIYIDGTRVKIDADLQLIIEEPYISDTGLYSCQNDIKYLVDVVEFEETQAITQVELLKNISISDFPRPTLNYFELFQSEQLFEINDLKQTFYDETEDLFVYNLWSEWSSCDRCGYAGQSRRIGICTVAYLSPIIKHLLREALFKTQEQARKDLYDGSAKIAADYGAKNTNGLTDEQILERNRKLNHSIEEYLINNVERIANEAEMEILQKFNIPSNGPKTNKKYGGNLLGFLWGIPCRSRHLESMYKEMNQVKRRKSLIVYAPCQNECPREQDLFYIQKGSNEQETDSLKIPKLAGRNVIYETEGSDVLLHCPGNKEGLHLIWNFQKQEFDLSNMEKNSNGRMTVDWNNNILVRNLTINDSGIYSCWKGTALYGTIKLHVIASSIWTKSSIFLSTFLHLGVVLTFLVMMTLFLGLLKNMNLKTKV